MPNFPAGIDQNNKLAATGLNDYPEFVKSGGNFSA